MVRVPEVPAPEVALSPAQRSAMIYALDPDRRAQIVRRSLDAIADVDGIGPARLDKLRALVRT